MYVHRRYDPNDRYRDRRRRARRGKRLRRAAIATALLAAAAAVVLGATFFTRGGETTGLAGDGAAGRAVKGRVPKEIRGVHVTMGLASIEGKLGQYFALRAYGLNTIELDVKDENGSVGFASPALPEARARHRLRLDVTTTRRPSRARRTTAHIYLIGRVVTFADPTLAPARPDSGAPVARRLGLARPRRARVAQPVRQASLGLRRRGRRRPRRRPGSTRSSSTTCASRATARSSRSSIRGACASRRTGRSRASFATRASGSIRSASVCRPTSSGSLRRAISASASRRSSSAATSTRSTRWSTRRTSCRASTTSWSRRRSPVGPSRTRSRTTARTPRRTACASSPGSRTSRSAGRMAWPRWRIRCEAARQTHADGFLLWNPLGVYTQEALASR